MASSLPDLSAPPAMTLWKRFHWAFFVNTQGLTMALLRFERFFHEGDLEGARRELVSAATLMRASGASMQLAGSFSRQAYQEEVRPSMMPPAMETAGFSGLMSWDHSSLIELWRRLGPVFSAMPETLDAEYRDFVAAYGTLAQSHTAVCARFVQKGEGSIRYESDEAVESLRRFRKGREAMLDPSGHAAGCPVHDTPPARGAAAADDEPER